MLGLSSIALVCGAIAASLLAILAVVMLCRGRRNVTWVPACPNCGRTVLITDETCPDCGISLL
jgi:rRNA maturation endonuclease Nob1